VAKTILIDEFHVSIRAPRGLRDAGYAAMRRTLDDRGFQAELRRAVRDVVRRHPPLSKVRLTLTR
jgi:hypothetical protein